MGAIIILVAWLLAWRIDATNGLHPAYAFLFGVAVSFLANTVDDLIGRIDG